MRPTENPSIIDDVVNLFNGLFQYTQVEILHGFTRANTCDNAHCKLGA
jgi:hypothetical protein